MSRPGRWLRERWRSEGRWARSGWALVAAALILALVGPIVVRRVHPDLACLAAWRSDTVELPARVAPVGSKCTGSNSNGTAWLSSGHRLLGRDAARGEDPWGRPWRYDVVPCEQDADWRDMVLSCTREVARGTQGWNRNLHTWAGLLAGGVALRPYSLGPDGVDQGGASDDVPVKPLLLGPLGAREHTLALARSRPWLLAGAALLGWWLLAWSLGRRRWPAAGEALVAALLAALPMVALVLVCEVCAWSIRRHPLVEAWAERPLLPPERALAASLCLLLYLALLAWRLRRRGREAFNAGA